METALYLCIYRFLLCPLVLCLFLAAPIILGHNDEGPSPDCRRDADLRLQAPFMPGIITVDGNNSDWKLVQGQSFAPLQAISPDPYRPYPFGNFNMKVAHDGHDVFFMLEVPGDYIYTQGQKHECPSVALMFGVGDDATYHNMGGCAETRDACSSASCNGHEVDIMHFSIGNAIPGRQYGANYFDNINGTGKDSFGNLNDLYGWNPHCCYYDGLYPNGTSIPSSGAQNDWRGAWSHSSMDISYGLTLSDSPYASLKAAGTYIFEFARPLRTSDRLQQDIQFTIGGSHRFIAALWYPINKSPWKNAEHYSASCDWLPLDILSATSANTDRVSHRLTGAINAISLLLSITALGASIAVGWWVTKNKGMRFQSLDGL